jgi:hypothetical protein
MITWLAGCGMGGEGCGGWLRWEGVRAGQPAMSGPARVMLMRTTQRRSRIMAVR